MRIVRVIMDFITEVIPVLLLCLTTLVVAADVIARTLFSRPVFAASEIALIAFVGLVWFGAVGVARQNELMAVHYFVHRMGRLRAAAEFLTDLIVLGIIGYTLHAVRLQVMTARFTVFETTELPKWTLAAGVGVALVLMGLVYLHRLWLRLVGRYNPPEPDVAGDVL
jgi:TRAP-type C4-dicarboxylate transport system permease small subunit